MSDLKTLFAEGESILFPEGPRVVVAVSPMGYTLRDITGQEEEVSWLDLTSARAIRNGYVEGVANSVIAMWEGLSRHARDEALDRLEIVLTILTGYARGHACLARAGEPFTAFDPARALSLRRRVQAMEKQLAHEAALDRQRLRSQEGGYAPHGARVQPVSEGTLRLWVKRYEKLRGAAFSPWSTTERSVPTEPSRASTLRFVA